MSSLYPTPKSKRRVAATSATVSRPELTEEQRQEVKEAFELFDTDKDGVSARWPVNIVPRKPNHCKCILSCLGN